MFSYQHPTCVDVGRTLTLSQTSSSTLVELYILALARGVASDVWGNTLSDRLHQIRHRNGRKTVCLFWTLL